MSVPDPLPPRKPRRIALYAPFVLALLAAIVWSGLWFWLRIQTKDEMDQTVAELKSAGYEVSWTRRTVGGYPFRLNVTLTEMRVREPSGWGLAAPVVESESFVHGLGRWVIAAPEGLTFTRPAGGPVKIQGKVVRASLSGLDKRPPNFSFEGVNLRFQPEAGAQPFPLTGAERVELHLRARAENDADLLFRVDGGKARQGALLQRLAGDKPVAMIWDSGLSQMSAFTGDAWPEAVRAWTAAGGRMQVRQAGLTAGDIVAGAQSGDLTVGSDGRIRGRLAVTLRQAGQAFEAMAASGLIPAETADIAEAVTRARQGEGETLNADLNFEAGRATLGPVALAPAPRVY